MINLFKKDYAVKVMFEHPISGQFVIDTNNNSIEDIKKLVNKLTDQKASNLLYNWSVTINELMAKGLNNLNETDSLRLLNGILYSAVLNLRCNNTAIPFVK
jgi:transcriptional regulator of NAD metabolism